MNSLTGRDPILSVLGSHLEATAGGSGRCVVLEGPFGVGKTRLLQAVTLEAADRGLTVVAGRAGDAGEPAPLHLLTNFLRQALSGADAVDDLTRPGSNPFWLVDRIGELVENVARRRPLVIVLDDAHRIDDVSALALRELVRSLASSPVLWVLARRPVPASRIAQQALDWLMEHAAVRLHVGALDDEAVAELATRVLGTEPDSSVLRWGARCEGNPWLVEKLFHAFAKAGQVVVMDGTASVLGDRVPPGIRAAVDRLLDTLPAGVRRLVDQGGGTGRPFTAQQVADVLGEPAAGLLAAAEVAVRVGLLRREGTELVVANEVLAEAFRDVASTGGTTGGTTGSTTGDATSRSSATPGPVAPAAEPEVEHFRAARPDPVPSVPVPSAPVPSAAVPAAPSRSGRAGRGDDAMTATAVSALVRRCDGAPQALAGALRLLVTVGRDAEASALLDSALLDSAVRPGLAPAGGTSLVPELALRLRDAGCHDVAAELLRRAPAGQDIGEQEHPELGRAVTEAASHAGTADRAGGEPGTTARWPGQAATRAPGRSARPLWTWLVRALVAVDQFDAASTVLDAVREEAERAGGTWPEVLWHGHRAELLMAVGRLDEARAAAESALRLTDGSAPDHSVPAHLMLARVSTHSDDIATASDHLRVVERLIPDDAPADRSRLDWTLAQFHAASGRPAMMVRTLIDIEGRTPPSPLLFSDVPTAAATLVRQARQAGLDSEAEQATAFARHVTELNPDVRSLKAGAEHATGVLRDDAAALHRAAELYRLAGRPLAAGNALEDAARVERSTGDKSRTVSVLETALDLYLDCGAARDTARMQRKLRRLGVHHVRRIGIERRKSGWESLTGAELRVVRAIVDGRTNREAAHALFLSPHTVDSHLRRVFSKLDINSRVELTKYFFAHEASSAHSAGARRPEAAAARA